MSSFPDLHHHHQQQQEQQQQQQQVPARNRSVASTRAGRPASGSNNFHSNRHAFQTDPRRALTQRLTAQSVRLRKQRKEEFLKLKRRQQPVLSLSSSSSLYGPATSDHPFPAVWQAYWQHPETETLRSLLRSFYQNVFQFKYAIREGGVTGTSFAFNPTQWMMQHPSEAQALVSLLAKQIQQNEDAEMCPLALSIILELSSLTDEEEGSSSSSNAKTLIKSKNIQTDNEEEGSLDYYGKAPPLWSEILLLAGDTNDSVPPISSSHHQQLIPVLMQCLLSQKQQQQSQQPRAAESNPAVVVVVANIDVVDTILRILANLLLDETANALARSHIRPFWSTVLVPGLPATALVCAALVKSDTTSYAMNFVSPSLVTSLIGLFKEESTAVWAAWMLQGLTRREDAGIEYFLEPTHREQQAGTSSISVMGETAQQPTDSTTATSNTTKLLLSFLQRFHQACIQSDTYFLVPALQTIANMAVACQGRYVPLLLQFQNSLLVQSLCYLLDSSTATTTTTTTIPSNHRSLVYDCLCVLPCLLCDAGRSQHPSTDLAAPTFVPRLVTLLAAGSSSSSLSFSTAPPAEWKAQAVQALQAALSEPPVSVSATDHEAVEVGGTVGMWESATITSRAELELNLQNVLMQGFWQHANRDRCLESLLDLTLRLDEVSAVLASLWILDKVARWIPSSHSLLDSMGLPDRLTQVCDGAVGRASSDLDTAANVAANLLDDYFDQDDEHDHDDDDDDDEMNGTLLATSVPNHSNQFHFGLTGPPVLGSSFSLAASAPPIESSVPSPATASGMGRGRGRTVPAWMK